MIGWKLSHNVCLYIIVFMFNVYIHIMNRIRKGFLVIMFV